MRDCGGTSLCFTVPSTLVRTVGSAAERTKPRTTMRSPETVDKNGRKVKESYGALAARNPKSPKVKYGYVMPRIDARRL
jgi:hypothetical protein